MLISLHIENYALIRSTDIVFAPGMTSITGETGAGKTILLGALGLLLGQRADSAVLHDKERKCVVEAEFRIDGLGLGPLLAEADLDSDDTLIVRREILPSAKSRAFVNDTPVQLPLLRQLGTHLVDIHSQHETLTLTGSDFQLRLLDTFDGARAVRDEYVRRYAAYVEAKRRLEELAATDAQNRRDRDYTQFLFDELVAARLDPDEQETLEQESRLLSHAEGVKEALSEVMGLCDADSDDSALSRLGVARSRLARTASAHPDAETLSRRMDAALVELRDILRDVAAFDDRVRYSPERQAEVDQRLDLLYRLEKKHSVDSEAQLVALRDDLGQRLQTMEGTDEAVRRAMEAVDNTYAEVREQGDLLTELRQRSARHIERHVAPLLAALGMEQARLVVQVEATDSCGPTGSSRVRFLFNANLGGELRELGAVASGGELSRLMLALKSLTAGGLPTLVFDEIDSGISGQVSAQAARIVSQMPQQVLVVTHQPQMAAAAAHQFEVYKAVEGDATESRIRLLGPEERTRAIAVMLSAEPPSPAALQTARELLTPPFGKGLRV